MGRKLLYLRIHESINRVAIVPFVRSRRFSLICLYVPVYVRTVFSLVLYEHCFRSFFSTCYLLEFISSYLIMAAAAVDSIPSYNRVEPGSCKLQAVAYPQASDPAKYEDVDAVASEWVTSLTKALNGQDYNAIKRLFLPEACWRDQLGLSWNYHTFAGPQKIIDFLKSGPHGSRIKSVEIDKSNAARQPSISAVDYNGKINGVASFLTIKTDVGRGRGLLRLLKDPQDGEKWKAFTLFTTMHELQGHEETVKANRPHGVEHGGKPGRKNWAERRTATENYEGDSEPTVLIIGESGLPRKPLYVTQPLAQVLGKAALRLPLVFNNFKFPRLLLTGTSVLAIIGEIGALSSEVRCSVYMLIGS